jgi:PEP-CTERM motif
MLRLLLAGLLALSATPVLAVTTVSGHFSATDWFEILPNIAPPHDPLFLNYEVSFDASQIYANDAAALTVIATNIPYALRFSFNPISQVFVIATDGNPNGCALSAGSFCAAGFNMSGGIPGFVAQVPVAGGAWQAATVTDESRVGPIGVPEPGSWAMLIAGFGLVGAAQRQRSRLAV